MDKKRLTEARLNVGIVESYKKAEPGSPVLGSFSVKKMVAENVVSQNRTRYSEQVWASPNAFGNGGKFIDESGKLRPTSLLGSLDHPLDDRAEITLNEAAIIWRDVTRNEDGSWDGTADILDTPQGRITKTMLEYAKLRGGGELLGVSSRALGDSETVQESAGYIEDIIAETFDLQSVDVVYNPSFQNKANLNESTKNLRPLTESIKALAEDDEDHKEIYEQYAEKLEGKPGVPGVEGAGPCPVGPSGELGVVEEATSKLDEYRKAFLDALEDYENEITNAIYALKKMSDEDFKAKYGPGASRDKVKQKLEAELEKVKGEIYNFENGAPLQSAVESTVTEDTNQEPTEIELFLEADNVTSKAKWGKENVAKLVWLGFINIQSFLVAAEAIIQDKLGEEGLDQYNQLGTKKKLENALKFINDEFVQEQIEPWALDFYEQISTLLPEGKKMDPEQLYKMRPENVVEFIEEHQDIYWCQLKLKELQQNKSQLDAVLGDKTMTAESISVERRGYRVVLSEDTDIQALTSYLEENEIQFKTSEYRGKTRFDMACNIAERIDINAMLRNINEKFMLRIQKDNLFEDVDLAKDVEDDTSTETINESDIIDDFVDDDDADDEEADDEEADDEEADEDDEESDDEESDDEESDDEESDDEEEDFEPTIKDVWDLLQEVLAMLQPVEDADLEDIDLGDPDEDLDDELDLELDDEDVDILDELEEEDLDAYDDEELEYLLALEEAKRNKQ